MHLFTDYIQPLTLWLYEHPHLALIITFFVSFAESLAIIGSIIPGSVTMTAIGILAGSGLMRIDLTLLAAALGAVAGDSASYMLGTIYSDRLTNFWPFSRYPNWIYYGKNYFAKHGGKSVLIGRFVGPLRSIIPVIAGMMHMNHFRFYVANIISAIAWSLLYVMPGVLIGTASSELSPESATRLFVIILFVLAGIWLISAGLKWLLIRIQYLMRINLHQFWLWAMNNRYFGHIAKRLTPAQETNHYPTAALFFILIFSSVLFTSVVLSVCYGAWIGAMNQSIQLLFQSLRTHSFDVFFIIASQLTSFLTLVILFISITLITFFSKDWRALFYWLSLSLSSILALVILHLTLNCPNPQPLLGIEANPSFPVTGLTIATALYTSIFLYINAYSPTRFKPYLKIALVSALLVFGLTPLYLSDNWLSDILGAYLCGLSLSLAHWLFYRRCLRFHAYHPAVPLMILILLLLTTLVSALFSYPNSLRIHQPYFAQYDISDERWWNQTNPMLPIYRTNRIGRRISLFNLQYVGSLNDFENALINYGWQKQNDSLLNAIVMRVNSLSSSDELPLMAQLYLNKKPVLVMTYKPSDGNPLQILRIWRSNYHLQPIRQPIWLGSIHPRRSKHKTIKTSSKSIHYLSSALPTSLFQQRNTAFPARVSTQQLPTEVEPVLLLIKKNH